MTKKAYKIILTALWVVFYAMGCWFAPFVRYDACTEVSCLFFFFSACAVAVLGIYECRLEKQTSSLITCILKRWVLYLPILGEYIRIFAALISR